MKHGVSVERVADTLRSLSSDDVDEHKLFTESQTSVFEKAHNQSALIGHLDFSMNYLSYHLLHYIVTEFNLEDVKDEMEAYESDLQQFRERAKVNLFCEIQAGRKIKHVPDFEELVVEFYHSTSSVDLEVIECFRQMYAAHYNLKDYSMIFAGIYPTTYTFNCTWLIPQSVVSLLKNNLPKINFFKKHSVSGLSIAGILVYNIQQVRLMSTLELRCLLIGYTKGCCWR